MPPISCNVEHLDQLVRKVRSGPLRTTPDRHMSSEMLSDAPFNPTHTPTADVHRDAHALRRNPLASDSDINVKRLHSATSASCRAKTLTSALT